MKDLKHFNIPFAGLKDGSHLFEYQIDNKFFDAFNFDEYNNSNIKVKVDFIKKPTLLEFYFTASGTVNVPCDTTGELFDQEIKASLPLLVKFGSEFSDENEEILILPQNSYEVNISQYIYEMIVLAVPSKRIHPDVLNGTMDSEALKKLEKLRVQQVNTAENADPRWDKLKDLIK
jgi:uncharacterized metal-binding protein YceD (DUF177 family)